MLRPLSHPPDPPSHGLPPLAARVVEGEGYLHPHTMRPITTEHLEWAMAVLCPGCRGGRAVAGAEGRPLGCLVCRGCGFNHEESL